jgi:hypothetical protein
VLLDGEDCSGSMMTALVVVAVNRVAAMVSVAAVLMSIRTGFVWMPLTQAVGQNVNRAGLAAALPTRPASRW